MREISCEMCRDLMPLVIDGVASTDSRESVEHHVAGCEACRGAWTQTPQEPPVQDRALSKAVRRIQAVSFSVVLVLLGWTVLTASLYFGELAAVFALVCVSAVWLLVWAFRKSTAKWWKKLIALVLTAAVLVVGHAFAGNPVSWLMARLAVNRYLEETYPGNDYTVERVTYNFKFSDYYAPVTSESSIDTHFTVHIDCLGRIRYDTFDSVTDGWNTQQRLRDAYRALVEPVKQTLAQSYTVDIWFGDLEIWTKQAIGQDDIPDYALWVEDLEVDGIYDINALGTQAGKLVVYIDDSRVDARQAAQILLDIRAAMDEAGIPFRAVDLVLTYPKQEDGTQPEGRIETRNFARDDIFAEGLEERVEQANRETVAYYEAMDK